MRDEDKRFILVDEEGSNVLGGELTINNAYINIYAKYVDFIRPKHLEVGESIIAYFSLSGTNGTYWVKRIK
jgi:hypothetical protein